VTSEASSLAGHQELGNLIAIYDQNQISIEDDTDATGVALGVGEAHGRGEALAQRAGGDLHAGRMAVLRVSDDRWTGRDRFILSPGHTSLTLYIQLFLGGFGLEMKDLEELRTWGSSVDAVVERGLARRGLGVEEPTGVALGVGEAHGRGLYIQLFLGGFGLEMKDLEELRTWGSKTPGHPEYRHTAGVEITTGPLSSDHRWGHGA
jgi:transketolase